jgi:hypothetical protein
MSTKAADVNQPLGPSGSHSDWADGTRLRVREVSTQEKAVRWQKWAAVASVVTSLAAAYAAWQAGQAVKIASTGIERQADENRLSTAIDSIGAPQLAERVAGFTMLRRHVETMMDTAVTEGDADSRADAYNLYDMSLEIFENYLKNPVSAPAFEPSVEPVPAKEPVVGRGHPDVASDVQYAANDLRGLLNQEQLVSQLDEDNSTPTVDLTGIQLYRKPWEGIDFSWLAANYSPKIDLRGANLTDSAWGEVSTLDEANLQCAVLINSDLRGTSLVNAHLQGAALIGSDLTGADLEGADLTEANLKNADLSGANLTNANLSGANMKGADVAEARHLDTTVGYFTPGRIHSLHYRAELPGLDECLNRKDFWTPLIPRQLSYTSGVRQRRPSAASQSSS